MLEFMAWPFYDPPTVPSAELIQLCSHVSSCIMASAKSGQGEGESACTEMNLPAVSTFIMKDWASRVTCHWSLWF